MLSSQRFEFDAEMFYRKSKTTKCRVRNSIIEPPFPCLIWMQIESRILLKNQSNFSVKKTSENVLFASDSAFLVFVQICLKDHKNVSFYNK